MADYLELWYSKTWVTTRDIAKGEDECRGHTRFMTNVDFEGGTIYETHIAEEVEPVGLRFGGQVTPTWGT